MVQQARGMLLEDLAKRHRHALQTGSRLTSYFREGHQPMAVDVKPEHVIEVLHDAGIRCVLMGTHALNTYRDEPRATQDVDVLVRKKDVSRAIRVLRAAFVTLTLKDAKVVARFIDPSTGKPVIDLMKPTQKVYQMVFRQTVAIGETHRIPNLEMALISKFAAFTSPNRDRVRKMQDVTDFASVLQHNQKRLDVVKLARLAQHVYEGGATEVVKLMEDILSGRPIQV